jgi:hypothetical protein
VGARQDHTVPDEFYARVPMIARFIEDLIEHDPANRLLLFPAIESPAHRRYEILRERFLAELSAAEAAEENNQAPTDDRWAHGLLAQLRYRLPEALRPLGGMPGRLRRVRKSLRNSQDAGALSATSSGSLLFWSWLSATALAVAVSLTITWTLRQLTYHGSPWQWGTRSVQVYQTAVGHSQDQALPFIDNLRRADYVFPDLAAHWPALLVCLTYVLVGAKYYQNLFAGVIPLRVGWHAGRLTAWAVSAQFFMRLQTVACALLVFPAVLIEPRWWPIDTAIGQILVYLTNRSVLSFTTTALDRARAERLTSVPSTNAITGVSAFGAWVPTSLFYAAAASVIGTLIFLGRLHDEWMYALAVSAINFFVFYISKCGKGAAEVRVAITRAAFAGERLRRMAERRQLTGAEAAPPALATLPAPRLAPPGLEGRVTR